MWKWLIAVLGVSTPALAEPVRFTCGLDIQAEKFSVLMVADEKYNVVSILLPSTRRAVVRAALFTPSQIIVDDEGQSWHLDRKTLKLRREVMVDNTLISDDGACTIADKAMTAPQ